MLTPDSEIVAAIDQELHIILEQKSVEPDLLDGTQELTEIGLSSLDLAQLVTVLEARLEIDPFQELVPITSVRTLEDFRQAYHRAFAGALPSEDASDELLAAQARVRARRGNDR